MKRLAEMIQPYLKPGTDEEAVKKIIADGLLPIAKTVDDSMAEIRDIAKKATGGVLSIEIKKEGEKEVKKIDGVHKDFDTLLKLIQVGDHVYMWGPPGSGKSTAARQVSDALGIEFGYISLNPQTPDSRILGYLDAGGHYRSTVFRKLYEEGGVMCIDEMDNAAPSLCVTINSGLESDLMAFPDRMVKRSPKFVLVATGNTTGRGANPSFPERRPFDSAFAERFTYLEWNYDHSLERAIALAHNPKAVAWVDWIQKVRAFCVKTYPRVVVSPRASFKGAKLLGKFKEADIAEMVLFKGLDRDTVKAILKGVA
jgi:cobaltochelatase CobS